MLSQFNVQSDGHRRLRNFLVVLRWLAVFLGLAMTGFGNQKSLINPLNQFLADLPYILNILLLVYHAIATFVMLRFDDNRFNVVLLMILDAIAGAYMSYYFGMPYFYAAVLVPTLVAAFYFDILVCMVVALVCTAFYGSVITVPMINIIKSSPNAELKISYIINTLETFLFSSIAIFVGFRWSQRQEEEVHYMIKKFSEEKNMLYESHQATKKEFGAVFTELENKQELLAALEDSVEKAHEEKKMLMEELESTRKEIDDLKANLRSTLSKTSATTENLEQLSQEYEEQKAEFEKKIEELTARIEEMEEESAARDEAIEEQNAAIEERDVAIQTRNDIIEEREKMIEKLQEYVYSTKSESSGRVDDLEQKIALLVSKINQQNSALQARENLFEAYAKINENIDTETTYTAIVNESIRLVPSQTAILFCEEETENGPVLFAEAAATPYKNLFVDYSVFPGEGPVGMALRMKQPVRIDNGETKLKSGEEVSTLLTYEKSALVVPVLHEGLVMGVLYLGNPKPNAYTDKEAYLMASFCKLAGPTINTAKTIEQAAQLVLTEPDTGLYNEAYFFERFTSEIARAIRYQIPVTLTLLEIENFERFTQSADKNIQGRIIRDLSEILKTSIRETDIPARLSEERFAILFLHSEKRDTLMVAERIRMSAEMRSFGNPIAKRAGLHLSIGLANFPEDGENRDDLYEVAMSCVAEAKRKGGNKTIFAP